MESNTEFAYKMFIFSIVLMVTLPLAINIFIPSMQQTDAENIMDDYYRFTGTEGTTKEAVWVLTGIYTPYEGDTYNYTPDGWLYGARISEYSPSQYDSTTTSFTVYRDDTGIYRYKYNSADYDPDKGIGHRGTYQWNEEEGKYVEDKPGDIYTAVTFEWEERSDIFFSSSGKHNADGDIIDRTSSTPFYYDFSGWRFCWQPTANYKTADADGNEKEVIATTTSLSLIVYYYYTANGLAGQLVLSGSDYGVAYLSGDQIVRAFDSTTSTARFSMVFNGVEMGVYVRLDPSKLAENYTVKDCFDLGYWSIMITSLSTDINAYIGADAKLDIFTLFETMIDLLTFNYNDYGMSTFMGTICSFIIVIPLYAGLIALAISSWQAMALVALIGVIEGIAAAVNNFGDWFDFNIDLGIVDPMLTIIMGLIG